MATVAINIEARNNAQRELLRLRQATNDLNRALNEQRQALRSATGEERKSIQAKIAANTATRASIRAQQEDVRIRKSRIDLLIQEQREQQRVGRQVQELGFQLHLLGQASSLYADTLQRLVGGWIQASTELEKYTSILRLAAGDSAVANSQLTRLLQITRELTGIDTATLIQFSARYQTVGLSAQEAENAIVSVTRRMEEQGKASHVTRRILEQLSDAINANAVDMRDFRPILREYPTFFQDLNAALGTSINSIEDLRSAADEFGGIRNLLVQAFGGIREIVQGAEVDTLNYQFNQLRDNMLILRASLGRQLAPALLSVLKLVNSLATSFSNLNPAIQTFIAVLGLGAAALFRFAAAFAQTAVQIGLLFTFNTAVDELTHRLGRLPGPTSDATKAITRWTGALAKGTIIAGGVLLAIATVTAAYTHMTRHIRAAREEQERFNDFQQASIRALAGGDPAIQGRIQQLLAYQQELEKTRESLQEEIGGFNIFAPRAEIRRVQQLNEQINENNASLQRYQAILEGGQAGQRAFRTELSNATDALLEHIKASGTQNATYKRLLIDFQALGRAYRNYGQQTKDAAVDTLELERALIRLDYQIRTSVDSLRASNLDNLTTNYNRAVALLQREYESQKAFAEATEDDQATLTLRLERLYQSYTYEKTRLDRSYAELSKKFAEDIANTFVENFRKSVRSAREILEEQRRLYEQLSQQQARIDFDASIPSGVQLERFAAFLQLQDLWGRLTGRFRRSVDEQRESIGEYGKQINVFAGNILNNALPAFMQLRDALVDREIADAARSFFDAFNARPYTDAQVKVIREELTGVAALRDQYSRLREVQDEAVRDAQRNLRRYNRLISSLTTNLSNQLLDFAFNSKRSFGEIAREFLRTSLRIIARYVIQTEIQKRLSNSLTAQEIRNIRAVETARLAASRSAIANSQAVNAATQAGGLGNLVGGLGNVSGIAPLAVVSTLFGNELGNLGSGIASGLRTLFDRYRIDRLFHNTASDRYALRSGYSAAEASLNPRGNADSQRNATDFTNFFSEGFVQKLQESGGTPNQPLVVNLQLNGKTLQSVYLEFERMKERGILK